ncbi:MAG: hypothetical protein WB615_01000, partial [Candidatus Tumulicola sp.]
VQYERDESDAFTKAYGDVVRTYARDDTESRRIAALKTFARFPGARVTRNEFPLRQALALDGVLGRAASSSYLPDAGPDAEALRRRLEAAFERHQRAGSVDFAMVTYVLIAELT